MGDVDIVCGRRYVTGIVNRKEVIIPVLIFLAMIAPRGVFSIAEYFGVDLPFVPMMSGWILTITILPLAFALFYKDVSPVIAFFGCSIGYILGIAGDAFVLGLTYPGEFLDGMWWTVEYILQDNLFGSDASFHVVEILALGLIGVGATRTYSDKISNLILIIGSAIWIFMPVRGLFMFLMREAI
ncbi:MAG: membrane protein [Candidatus Syntrophoarchaeum caldarius]|uniref:Membrane protein n=1 Tax=Candidatus Syntropharchaeum caldarium TaxID=1838285 RepID=A0A1F2PCQ6_9EURY|nr:MAG: membrane protein [Candidatus Syntrophoarchaeum caldarius]